MTKNDYENLSNTPPSSGRGGARPGSGRKPTKNSEAATRAYERFSEARAKREECEAALAELKVRQELGNLVNADEVRRAATAAAAAARCAFERIPDLLAERVAAETDAQAVYRLLADEIDQVLKDFASQCREIASEKGDTRRPAAEEEGEESARKSISEPGAPE